MNKLSATFVLIFSSVAYSGFSQQIQNLKAVVEGERIFITFDLTAVAPTDKFDLSIWASSNNFSSQLRFVSGDVGSAVDGGAGKRVVWSAKNELGNYKGDISFEVRAEVIAVFTQTTSLTSAKRGKPASLSWRGGRKSDEVKIELLRSGTLNRTIIATINDGNYEWAIPGDQKPGNDYQVRMINGSETSTSNKFEIKHKIPTLLKVVPIAALAAVVVVIAGGSKAKEDTKDSNLPAPPDLGLN